MQGLVAKGCKKGTDAMVRFLFALVALVCVGPQQDSTQERPITPHEKVKSVTLLTGQSTEVLCRATKALANLAKTGEFSNVSLHCSKEIPERVIAVFSSGFALQANGAKTIQPLVGSIDVDQVVFWYESSLADLSVAELGKIADYLPRQTQLPPVVEFFTDYSDPLTLGANHSSIITDRSFLAFLTELSDVENIRFVASVGLKATDSSEVAYLTIVQFDDLSDDDLYRIELKKGLVSEKTAFFVTAREGTRGPAAEFLHHYRDSLISKKAE